VGTRLAAPARPAVAAIELGDQTEPATGRSVDVRRQLGDLAFEQLQGRSLRPRHPVAFISGSDLHRTNICSHDARTERCTGAASGRGAEASPRKHLERRSRVRVRSPRPPAADQHSPERPEVWLTCNSGRRSECQRPARVLQLIWRVSSMKERAVSRGGHGARVVGRPGWRDGREAGGSGPVIDSAALGGPECRAVLGGSIKFAAVGGAGGRVEAIDNTRARSSCRWSSRGRGVGSCAAGHDLTATVLIVRTLARGVRQRISPSRRP
jgi:hypothetical protein